ncbi:MAG: hypothetical protein AB3N33_06850 [Puniceicoccaceae bacterium]
MTSILTHGAQLLLTFVYYGVLAISFYGWGRAVAGGLRRIHPSFESPGLPWLIWLGWAVWLGLLQTVHLFLPLTAAVVIPFLLVGLIVSASCLAGAIRGGWRLSWPSPDRKTAYFILLLVLAGAWISSRAMLHPMNYDAGLYFLNSIRWNNSYPIVPGLGNLHARLAFNQSFFTYVAALNLHPFFGHGRSVANSFLMLLTIGTALHQLRPILARPARIMELAPAQWVPPLFVLPVLGFLCLFSKDLPSPSPDLAVELLLITLFLLFSRLWANYLKEKQMPIGEAFVLVFLTATTMTLKLSGLFASSLIAGLTVLAVLTSGRQRWRTGLVLILPAGLILLIWMVRGVMTSGAPLFPSTIGYIETSWSIPREAIREEAQIITSWAREPWTDHKEVIGNWNWFGKWLDRMGHFPVQVLYPTAYFLVLLLGNRLLFRDRQTGPPGMRPGWSVLPSILLASLVFWFFTAPDHRFARALFFLLPVSAIIPLAARLHERYHGRKFLAALGILFLTANAHFLAWTVTHPERFFLISYEGWHPIIEVPMQARTTDSGLEVNLPVTGQQSYDAPLPSTPYFNRHLQLRRDGDLSSGFTVVREPLPKNAD